MVESKTAVSSPTFRTMTVIITIYRPLEVQKMNQCRNKPQDTPKPSFTFRREAVRWLCAKMVAHTSKYLEMDICFV
jgi:hypothetical protein